MGLTFYPLKRLALATTLIFFHLSAWAQLTLVSPVERIVYQRNRDNRANIPIRGNWPANTTRIDARAVARNGQGQTTGWYTIATTSQNGQFQGSLPTAGGWYTLEVRAMANTTQLSSATIERVGVGEVFLIAGHSVAQGQDINLPGSDDERVSAAPVYPGTQTYANYENTASKDYLPRNFVQYSSGVTPAPLAHGSYFWGRTGQYLAQRLNVPVLLFNAGFGGTSLEQWAKSAQGQRFDHPFVNSAIGMPYVNVRNTLQLYASQTGIRGILSDHGQNDWPNTNEDQVLQYYQTWVNQARADLGWPSLAVVVNRQTPFRQFTTIRRVQDRMAQASNCFPGPDYDYLDSGDRPDGIHLGANGAAKAAQYWADALNESFFNNSQPYVISALSTAQPVGDQPTNQPPVAPSLSTLTATVDVGFNTVLPAFTDPENDALTYSLTGSLPAGLSFNTSTRRLSGTPSQSGSFSLSYAASDQRNTTRATLNLTVSGSGSTNPTNPPVAVTGDFEGYFDDATCDKLRGWVWDRNRPNQSFTVEFLEGSSPSNATVRATFEASQYRDDLQQAGKGNGAHGFDLPLPEVFKNGQNRIIWARIQGSTFLLTGSSRTVNCAGSGTTTPTPTNQPPVAPSLSTLTATVGVGFNTVLPAFTDPENDALTYSLTGSLPAGLSFNTSTRRLSGTPSQSGSFSLSYTASDQRNTTRATLNLTVNGGGSTNPTNPPVAVTGDFEGYFDDANCDKLRGWVWDRNRPNQALTVEFLEGPNASSATVRATVEASQYRDDLQQAGKGNGAHGFDLPLPEVFKNGQNRTIWARIQGSTFLLTGSSRTVNCAGSGTTNPTPTPTNQPPVAPSLSMLTATVGVGFNTVLPAFSDPENDALTYSLTGSLPAGLSFNTSTRRLSGTPNQSGSFSLSYAASDQRNTTRATLNLTVSGGGTTNPTNPPVAVTGDFEGYFDDANCDKLRGWVWDRNRPNQSFTVEFLEGSSPSNATVRATFEANQYRDDLQQAGKGNGAHGFDLPLPEVFKNGQNRTIWARIQGSTFLLTGSSRTVNCAGSGTTNPTPTPTNQPPVAPSLSTITATVGVGFNTVLPAFSDPENDALTYSLTGSLPAGLSFNTSTRRLSGTPSQSGSFTLSYAASDQRNTTRATLNLTVSGGGSTTPTNPPVTVTGDFEGFFDSATCNGLGGWVWDRNRPNQALTVEFLEGPNASSATVRATVEASQYRDDLQQAGKGNGAHGFGIPLPSVFRDGQPHQLYARVQGSTFFLKSSVEPISCPVGAARISGEVASSEGSLQVNVLGNPVTTDEVALEISGTSGQPVHIQVVDLQGHLIAQQTIDQPASVERPRLFVGKNGLRMLVIRVASRQQVLTVKTLQVK